MEELQHQLLADAAEILKTLAADISELRVARLQGPHRRELAARIFRHVHTLKGTASSLRSSPLLESHTSLKRYSMVSGWAVLN